MSCGQFRKVTVQYFKGFTDRTFNISLLNIILILLCDIVINKTHLKLFVKVFHLKDQAFNILLHVTCKKI